MVVKKTGARGIFRRTVVIRADEVISLRKNSSILTTTLRIGSQGDAASQHRAAITLQLLNEAGIRAEVVSVNSTSALLQGDIDVLPADMSALPAWLPDGWAISAVSVRNNPSDALVVQAGRMAAGKLFGLSEGAVVGYLTPVQKAQFAEFRPDVSLEQIAQVEVDQNLSLLQQGLLDGLLVPAHSVTPFIGGSEAYTLISLHPQEMIPPPAQGVIAWIACAEDIPTRRLLQKIHHPEVAAVTNIERMALRQLGTDVFGTFGAYCHRDAAGNYHVYAAFADPSVGVLKRASLSSSTHFRLSERLIEGLS